MEWLNEPASWQRTGDVLTVSVDPSTDFWRETGYGYIRDSGHVYGEVLAGDLDVSVRMRCTLGVQYDQAGVMLRADERTWLKTGVEFFEGRARLSTVLTLGRSSWMVTDLPAGTDEIVLRVSRRGDAVEVRYVIEDGPAELAALVFMPPGREVLAGVMAAAPEGPGFRVTFHDLRITERDWSGAAGDDPAWSDDQAGWSGDAAPAWSPADGEAGWPAPETGEDAPGWPATAEEEPSAWPVPAAKAEAEEPHWQIPAAGDDDPRWPVPAAQEDDPGWRATAGEADDQGWAAPEDDEADWVAALAAPDGDDEPGWAAAPAAAEAGDQERAGVDEPAVADSPAPAGTAPAGAGPAETRRAEAGPAETGPAGTGRAEAEPAETGSAETRRAEAGPAETGPAGTGPAGTGPAGTGRAEGRPAGAGSAGAGSAETGRAGAGADSIAAALAGPEPVPPDPADAEHVRDEPAGPETVAEEPAAQGPAEKNGDGEQWSPAPLADHVGWVRPVSDNGAAEVDPAADWERLAAGAQASARAQAARAQAARWRAQTDADVANEWPGPPLRSAMRNGLLAGDAGLRPAVDEYVDEAQTDPGLTGPRQAPEEPGWAEASVPAQASSAQAEASTAPAEASTAPAETSTGPAEADRPEPAPSAREARRARSRRAAADVPAEPDAADEWISLLTADPVEE
jgi:regulation of enolase protein 1 (concanavalin A-like superfamily)